MICGAVIRYRRRSDEMPRQFQYHGAVEVFYTIVPIVIVLVIFGFTVVTENNIDALATSPTVAREGDRLPMGVGVPVPLATTSWSSATRPRTRTSCSPRARPPRSPSSRKT